MSCNCGCGGPPVLFYQVGGGGTGSIREYYSDIEYEFEGTSQFLVHEDVFRYELIFVSGQGANAQGYDWWFEDQILAGNWSGRVVMVGEHSGFSEMNNWINKYSSSTGLSVVNRFLDCSGAMVDGSVESGPALNQGVDVIRYVCTSEVVGGTPLSKTQQENRPWLAHNTVTIGDNVVDFVVSGDSNWLSWVVPVLPGSPFTLEQAKRIWKNLYDVPI